MMWIVFFGIIFALLFFDLHIAHAKNEEPNFKKSLLFSLGYISVGLLFSVWILWLYDSKAMFDYLTAYCVEKSLSIDNIFVISLIFTSFKVPPRYQHRVLFWGILGVVVMRALMIGLGLEIIMRFTWVLYIFGAFLIVTGLKLLFTSHNDDTSILESPIYGFLKRHLPITEKFDKEHFWVKIHNKWHATPLFTALIMIEGADLVFAVDSVPAVLAITTEPYIVYTSNIFAVLGLRSLYLLIASMMNRFIYLKYALSFILVFVGVKIFAAVLGMHIPSPVSLSIIATAIALGIGCSLYLTQPKNT